MSQAKKHEEDFNTSLAFVSDSIQICPLNAYSGPRARYRPRDAQVVDHGRQSKELFLKMESR